VSLRGRHGWSTPEALEDMDGIRSPSLPTPSAVVLTLGEELFDVVYVFFQHAY